MESKGIIFILSVFFLHSLHAQVSINTDGSSPNSSSILELKSTEKGFLPPRLTEAQRDAILIPATGLTIYVTDGSSPGYYQYNGTKWVSSLNLYSARSSVNCYLYNSTTVSTVKIQEGTSFVVPSGLNRKKITSVAFSTWVSPNLLTVRCRMYKISSGGVLGVNETLIHTNQVTSTSTNQYLLDEDATNISVSPGDILFFDLITPIGSGSVAHGAVTIVFEDNP